MTWLWVVVVTALAVEAFLRTPVLSETKALALTGRKSLRVLSSKSISDSNKERVLPAYAARIFKSSLLLFLCLLAPVAVVALGHYAGSLFSLDLWSAFVSVQGVALSLVSAFLYASLRQALRDEQGRYTPIQKALHYVVLSVPTLGEILLEIEFRKAKLEDAPASTERHVFVSGLARSGTTILMRSLYETGHFGSLTYSDMPFVLAPGLWAGIKGKTKPGVTHERIHGDGIMINHDSPEALEEVFWRTFSGGEYILDDGLKVHQPNPDLQRKFRNYIRVVLKQKEKQRYLSKNNNNIFRLPVLCELFPDSCFLIPYRSPVAHASSLLRQHRLFRVRQNADPFTRRYMRWLGHYEFGLDHRRFVPDDATIRYRDCNELNYWLELWVHTYTYLLSVSDRYSTQAILVGHEFLSEQPRAAWLGLCRILGISTEAEPRFKTKEYELPADIDRDLLNEANRLYERLTERCEGAVLTS